MRERGSLTLGLGITIAVLGVALLAAGAWAKREATQRAEVEGKFAAFKEGVKELGEKAEAEKLKEIERQKGVNNEREKSIARRVAAANARADSLCKSAGASAGCRELPAVPDTAKPVDDSARNKRLLEVLRHAQSQSDTLIELQEWVRQNASRANADTAK